MVEGIDDHVAVVLVPTATWFQATKVGRGLTELSARAPLWMPLFMVNFNDLGVAIERIAAAVDGGTAYQNPTTGVRLSTWTPLTFQDHGLEPPPAAKSKDLGFHSILETWKTIREQFPDWKIDFNPVQPWVHDFYVTIPGVGKLRVEAKERSSSVRMVKRDLSHRRTDPFADRRQWHVLLHKTSDGVVCIMRHEIPDATDDDDTFIVDRTFSNLTAALRRLEDKGLADAAKASARNAMGQLTPASICGKLPQWDIDLSGEDYESPLNRMDPQNSSAMWMAHSMNLESMRTGRGYVVALGTGHAVTSNLMIEHFWTEEEKVAYLASGKPPIDLWQKM